MEILTKEQRKSVANAQKITEKIGEKLKAKDKETKKVDLTKIVKELADRREKVLANDEATDE